MAQRWNRIFAFTLLFVAAGSLSTGCSDDVDDTNDGSGLFDTTDGNGSDSVDSDTGEDAVTQPVRLFTSEIDQIIVEVDYDSGAAPYIDSLTKNYWDIFKANAEELFEISNPTIDIPDELSEMEDVGVIVSSGYSASIIQALAGQYRDTFTSGSVASFYILFLDGFYEENGVNNENVIGVSIGDTGIIAIFKPVVQKLGATNDSRAMGEQATLVHEFGHAVGLVNNPIPPQADHHDAEHGAHCTNENCVMYYLNERPSELANFIGGLLGGTSEILFDDQCINDIRAVSSE